MKRLIFVAFAVLFVGHAFAANPTFNSYASATGDVTVDSTWDYIQECLDSLIVVCSDSATVTLTISGTAKLDPGDGLYVGIGNDSANRVSGASLIPYSNLDTFSVIQPKYLRGDFYVPFCFQYVKTNAGALTDTIYFNAGRLGNTNSEQVELYDVVVSAFIGDD